MAKSRLVKEKIVQDFEKRFSEASSVVFSSFSGFSVSKQEDLRREARKTGVNFVVAKKTLLARVFKKEQVNPDFSATRGITALAFGKEDIMAPAKLMAKFAREFKDQVFVIGGLLEGALVSPEQVIELAKLPPREVLLGKAIGAMKAPLSGFVNGLRGNFTNLVSVLRSIEQSKS